MPGFKARNGVPPKEDLLESVSAFAPKIAWFGSNDYYPHQWQTVFHTLRNPDTEHMCRFRHLVAGRRGGKTLSAAWELLYYLLHPESFHIDAHGKISQRSLVAWVLTRDYPAGLPALMTFREVLKQSGLEHGREYKENRGNRWFEFENGSYLFFKTADEPDALRGAGLDLLWMDEAAFIPNRDAWNVVRPALSDKLGQVICTTTPSGKNWYYEEFWSEQMLGHPSNGTVEYWSIDNPYFSKDEWEEVRRTYHPLLFKQEFCAAFDSMAGKELSGEWLHYYTWPDVPKQEGSRRYDLDLFVGVDPAISLSDDADKFAMACVGVTRDKLQVYLIDLFADRLPFPDQLDKIKEWHLKYRPQYIAIESDAYQAALSHQAQRTEGLPNILPLLSRGQGKKEERILQMAPAFKIGKVLIREDQRDFIDEWLNYDSALKNPNDDILDSVQIALRAAGALLPQKPLISMFDKPAGSLDELARRDNPRSGWRRRNRPTDEHLGTDW